MSLTRPPIRQSTGTPLSAGRRSRTIRTTLLADSFVLPFLVLLLYHTWPVIFGTYLTGLQSIGRELEEAAVIDGATR